MSSKSKDQSSDPQRHVEVLRRAVDDAAQQLRAANFTLVSVALYLFVAGLGTSHRDLLLGRMVKLPIFDVEVSLLWFYLLAPCVLVILHFTVLSLCGTVAQRLRQLQQEMHDLGVDPSERRFVLSLLHPHPLVEWLGRPPSQQISKALQVLSIVLPTMAMPIATLLWLESRFLPYQSWSITLLHSGYVSLDLLVIWFMWSRVFHDAMGPRPAPRSATSAAAPIASHFRGPWLAAAGGLTLVVAILATAPVGASALWGFEAFATLDVQRTILSEDGSAEAHASLAALTKDQLNARLDAIERAKQSPDDFTSVIEASAPKTGPTLQGRSLRGAILVGTSLAGADLTGADLTGADLRGTDFRGALLKEATLDRARLNLAHLEGADLTNASVRGADLPFSELQGAIVHGTDFTGADLSGAHLQFLRFRDAEPRSGRALKQRPHEPPVFWGAILNGAQLQGTPIERIDSNLRVDFRGADLRWAQLAGVDLRLFDLDGADLSGYGDLPEDKDKRDYVCGNRSILADCAPRDRISDGPPNFARLFYDAARVVTIETLKDIGEKVQYLLRSSAGACPDGWPRPCPRVLVATTNIEERLAPSAGGTAEPRQEAEVAGAEHATADVLSQLQSLLHDGEVRWCRLAHAAQESSPDGGTVDYHLYLRAFVYRVNEYRCQKTDHTEPPRHAQYLADLQKAEADVLRACGVTEPLPFEEHWCVSSVPKDIPDSD
jgi:uncharacterized protein YjbI with pentapeptide repeats